MRTRWMATLLAAVAMVGLAAGSASAQTFTLTANLTGAGETRARHQYRCVGNATVTLNLSTQR